MNQAIKQNYQSTSLQPKVASNLERVILKKTPLQYLKRYLPSVSVFAILGLWMRMSYSYDLHFKEALICSLIIGSIVLLRMAEQDSLAK